MKKFNLMIVIALVTLMIMTACGGKSTKKETKEVVQKPTEPKLKVYRFVVGDILVKDISLFNPGTDEGQSKRFTNSAYLIRHEKGDLIWDTGLPDALAELPDGNDSEAFLMKMPITMSSQLAEIGVKPEEVEYLALSHLHGDHTGNANLFKTATLLLQKEEYASLFEGETVNPAVDSLKNNQSVKLDGDHDVFGDGSVIIKRAPGHTSGHQVLFLDLEETGPVLLSGDLYHFTKNREVRGVPAFNVDKELTLASMDAIEEFLKVKNAKLWIQHDFEQNQGLPTSPEYAK